MQNTTINYFELFAITEQFNLDTAALETNYRKIQSETHPDRFINASSAEKMTAMQRATSANEAYSVLKSPARRAKYMLEQRGIDAIADTNTAMPIEFLMQQMEWRERIDEEKSARNITVLDDIADELALEAKGLIGDLCELFDIKNDIVAATEATRKLIFIDKVCADIDQIIEQLEQ